MGRWRHEHEGTAARLARRVRGTATRRRAWDLEAAGLTREQGSKADRRCSGAILPLAASRGLPPRTGVWVDPSGVYLVPLAVRTWAPCGQTPVLRVPLPHDHLAAISRMTPDGRLFFMFMQAQDHAYRSPDVVRFLRVLLRQSRGKLPVIWDGSPGHRGPPIKQFLHNGAAKRLHLEQLPGYARPRPAPGRGHLERSQVERSQARRERVALGNLCCRDLGELAVALRSAVPTSVCATSAPSSRRASHRRATMFSLSCNGQ